MKRIAFFLISVCIIVQSGFSQEKEKTGTGILFQGLVMDASTLMPVANSQIMINRNFTTISGNDGTFAFYVNHSDTVIFRSLGYKPAIMFISDTLSGSEFIAGIYMNSDTLSLGEVVIVPRITNLKSEILNAKSMTPSKMENAKYNVAISAYQGRNSRNSLGDPASNYEFLRQKQKIDAFERGGIPSDKIAGINPFLLLPAAYLLIHGFPEKPAPLKPQLTENEIDQIHIKYQEIIKKRQNEK
jgi:hypothetical protein